MGGTLAPPAGVATSLMGSCIRDIMHPDKLPPCLIDMIPMVITNSSDPAVLIAPAGLSLPLPIVR